LATSVSAFFNSFSLLAIFYRRYGSFDVSGIVQSILKFGIASIALGVVAYAAIHWPGFYAGRLTQRAAALGGAILAGTAAYFATASVLRTRELREFSLVVAGFSPRFPDGGRTRAEARDYK
jgi:peptidoglycan biosynthesis protein MviN/MurJ (putative lipid II flippase)